MQGLRFLKCPNCGAPINRKIPLGTAYICPYCQAAIEAPASFTPRPQEGDVSWADDNSFYYEDSSTRTLVYGILGALVALALGGLIVSLTHHPKKEPPKPPPSTPEYAETPDLDPVTVVTAQAPSDSRGVIAVTEQIRALEMQGCGRLLLPPTTVTGPQSIETKFIAQKGCVHILAVTGDDGEPLTLSLKTPSRQVVNTPPASPSIHFVFCPKKSGKHPMKIGAASWDVYTVAAVECPRGAPSPK